MGYGLGEGDGGGVCGSCLLALKDTTVLGLLFFSEKNLCLYILGLEENHC